MNISTKSAIQVIREASQRQDDFKQSLECIMNKYNISDAVFEYKNGRATESVTGYFVEDKEFDNIADAMGTGCNHVRIVENNKFITGSVFTRLSDCPEDKKVIDLVNLTYVR